MKETVLQNNSQNTKIAFSKTTEKASLKYQKLIKRKNRVEQKAK